MTDADDLVKHLRVLSESGGRAALRDVIRLCDLIERLRAEAKAARAKVCACSFRDSKLIMECEYHRLAKRKYGRRVAKKSRVRALEQASQYFRNVAAGDSSMALAAAEYEKHIRALMPEE